MMIAGKNLEVHGLTFDETRELGSSFDTAESGSSPCPSGNQLESIRRVGINDRKVEAKERTTYGRVEISFPAAATPITVETPHPLWQASRAARMTST